MVSPAFKLFALILFICAMCVASGVRADCDSEDDLTELDYSKCWPVAGGWNCRKEYLKKHSG